MSAYYNEYDRFAAAWLRELIKKDLIADGEVDERSITDVHPNDLRVFTQCHFFAGIGVWSYALRLAEWRDDRPVWTGSCPCPSFSAAGKGKGFADPRHLWPDWFRLIRECRPATLFGEQVNAAIGHGWLDLVQSDLEGEDYAVGKAVFGACDVGAPHIRQRLYFVAQSEIAERRSEYQVHGQTQRRHRPGRRGTTSLRAGVFPNYRMGYAENFGRGRSIVSENSENGAWQINAETIARGVRTSGLWADAQWLPCRDGKYRPVESGTFPLAHGSPARVGRLRGYGNAIIAPQAQAFIEAYLQLGMEEQ